MPPKADMTYAPESGSVADVLLSSKLGDISLKSTAGEVWSYLFGTTVYPSSTSTPQPPSSATKIWAMTAAELGALTGQVERRLNEQNVQHEENRNGINPRDTLQQTSFRLLLEVQKDWAALFLNRNFYLPERTVEGLEGQLGRQLGDVARIILQTPPLRAEQDYQIHVAEPLMELLKDVIEEKTSLNLLMLKNKTHKTVTQGRPDGLVCYEDAIILCTEVKIPTVSLDVAWQEAIGYSLRLHQQANYCTLVMAVCGNTVRMGLLTLLEIHDADGRALTPRPSRELPQDLRDALESADINVRGHDTVCTGNLQILYRIEFRADTVNIHRFDTTIKAYYDYALKVIIDGIEGRKRIAVGSNFLYRVLEGDQMAQNVPVFEEIHKGLKCPMKVGSCELPKTNKFDYKKYQVCITSAYQNEQPYKKSAAAFAELCAIVTCLHDKLEICHGNLIPENVIRTTSGVRLINWGFGSLVRSTPNNMDPLTVVSFDEWAEDHPRVTSAYNKGSFYYWRLVDIYSLFCFLWLNVPVGRVPNTDAQQQLQVFQSKFESVIANSGADKTTGGILTGVLRSKELIKSWSLIRAKNTLNKNKWLEACYTYDTPKGLHAVER